MDYIPDIIERGEDRCEAWALENVQGNVATCSCGDTFDLGKGETLSPNPYAIPVCPKCFEKAVKEKWGDSTGEEVEMSHQRRVLDEALSNVKRDLDVDIPDANIHSKVHINSQLWSVDTITEVLDLDNLPLVAREVSQRDGIPLKKMHKATVEIHLWPSHDKICREYRFRWFLGCDCELVIASEYHREKYSDTYWKKQK